MTSSLMKGWGKTEFSYDDPGNALAACLKANLNVFSAAKSLTEYKDFSALLFDKDGKLKSFNQFRQDVESLNTLYNENWLKSEYNTAIAAGQNTAKWQQFVKDGIKYIEYRTMEDDKVRPSHAILDSKIAAINDPIWNSMMPPLDWNCRCTIIPAEKGPESYQEFTPTLVKNAQVNKLFKNNPAVSGVVYGPSHTYFKNVINKLSELDAVKNYGMPSVESLYNTFNFPSRKSVMDVADIDKLWQQYKQQFEAVKEGFVVTDYSGRKILVPDKLKDKIISKVKRGDTSHDIASVINELIQRPDEAFISHLSSTRFGKIYTLTFIKYYENNPVALITDLRLGNPIIVKSIYEVPANKGSHISDIRRGILDKKIPRW